MRHSLKPCLLMLLLCAAVAFAKEPSGVINLKGQTATPFGDNKAKAVVLFFTTLECPISNRYAPEVNRIYEEFHKKGIQLYLVYTDPEKTLEETNKHYKEFKFTIPALFDRKKELITLSGATVTPEVAVFLPGKRLIYRGRIDNTYEDFATRRPKPTSTELRDTLKSIIAGKKLTLKTTKTIGCQIP